MKKGSMRTLGIIWMAVMIAVISSTATLLISGRSGSASSARVISEAEYENLQRYSRLEEIRELLVDDYYQPLDEDALMLGAIRGMTEAVGDIYTFYYTPEEMQRSNESSDGRYHGIGVLIQNTEEGLIEVLRVYPDTPAEAAGMQVGDVITAVDGMEISGEDGRTYNDAVTMIRGEDGTQVRLSILRNGEPMELSVGRADVKVSYASYQMLEDGIGYVSITQFTGNAADRFDEALEYFRQQGARGMIIDVRNDPGGLLDQVVRIADSILPKGVIVYIQDRAGMRTNYYSGEEYYDIPLVVLANDMSASASEILASSVQALGRGLVVGTTTYGKGIVQTLITFDEDGAGIQLTTSSYYDANGRSIHGTGVTPDVEVAMEGEVPLEPDLENDSQLQTALDALRGLMESAAQDAAA